MTASSEIQILYVAKGIIVIWNIPVFHPKCWCT